MNPKNEATLFDQAQGWSASRGTYVAVFALAALIAGAYFFRFGFPLPLLADEFAYLLAGETFSHFQLTATTPPSPASFQAAHILVEPSYASKYPPAQSLFLAVGFWLGHPAIGVAISGCLAASSLLWALRAWTSPLAAFFTAVLFVLTVLTSAQWMHSYMGGLVAFASAALVFGFFMRLRNGLPRPVVFLLLGVGVSGLLLSRPFEGGLVCALTLAMYSGSAIAAFKAQRSTACKGALLFTAPLALAIGFQLSLNHATTGDAFRLPYTEYQAKHMRLPVFLWQDEVLPSVPDVRLAEVERRMWTPPDWSLRVKRSIRFAWVSAADLVANWFPYLVLLGLPLALLKDWRLPSVLLLFPFFHGLTAYLGMSAYHAPITPLWFLIAACPKDRLLVGASRRPLLLIPVFGILLAAVVQPFMAPSPDLAGGPRHDIGEALADQSPSVAFISFDPAYTPHINVVYNDSKFQNDMLFANDLGAAANCAVARAFPERTYWMVAVATYSIRVNQVELSQICDMAVSD